MLRFTGISKEFLLEEALKILLFSCIYRTYLQFQKKSVEINKFLLKPQILLGTKCPGAATFSTSDIFHGFQRGHM